MSKHSRKRRSTTKRIIAALMAATCIAFVVVMDPDSAFSAPSDETIILYAGEPTYISLEQEVFEPNVKVKFSIDGNVISEDDTPPFDLAGTAFCTDSCHALPTLPFDTSQLSTGWHTLTVLATVDDGETQQLTASFKIVQAEQGFASDGEACTINGTNGDDTLNGTTGHDVICGRGGNDTINGLGGNDVIDGGAGTDHLDGGIGNDDIYGGFDNDVIMGGAGDDFLIGGAGTDEIHGGPGFDTLLGGYDNDRLYGDGDSNTLLGGWGNDTLIVTTENNNLDGGNDTDTCTPLTSNARVSCEQDA